MQMLIFVCAGEFESQRIFVPICMPICLQICMHICKPTTYIYVSHLEGDKIHFLYKMIDISGLCPDSRLQDVVQITYIS